MTINLTIDRIVLQGDEFASLSSETLRAAVAAELTSQLTHHTPQIDHGYHVHRTHGGALSGASPSHLATDLASSITSSISG